MYIITVPQSIIGRCQRCSASVCVWGGGGGGFLYPFHRTPLSLNSAEMKGKMEGNKKQKNEDIWNVKNNICSTLLDKSKGSYSNLVELNTTKFCN